MADWKFGSPTSGSSIRDFSAYGTLVNGNQDMLVDNIKKSFRNDGQLQNFLYGITQNGSGGNLTINDNSSIEFYVLNGPMIKLEGKTTAGIITNSGTLIRERLGGINNYRVLFDLGNNATAKAFINNGTIYWEGDNAIALWGGSNIGTIRNTGTIQSEGAVINSGNNATIGSIEFDGGLIQRIASSGSINNITPTTGDVISLTNANIGTITVSNSASIHGNISLSGTRITDKISFSDSNMTGNISLSRTTITDKISFGDSNMTGNISLNGSQVANGISFDGSNISGNISLAVNNGTHSTITNGFSIDNSKISGNITLANQSAIANGLSLSGNSTIANLNLTDRGYIDTLSLNQGTITGGISLTGNADGTGTNTATIGEITLTNNSTITGNISVKGDGASNNANAKIGNIILENGTGIGGSIAVGDSNGAANTNGEIAGITLNGNSTIAGGITNNANGNIGTIISNTGTNINNIITNHGTIGSLKVNNQGTIVYKSDSGIITDTLSVASGATLDIKNTSNNTGTIELKSDSATLEDGSTLNLANGSTLVGHLKNSGNLGDWTNESNIQGHFINTGTIGILNAGNIQEYLENTGVIQTLIEGQITGTLNNTGTIGELNTSVINYTNANTATIAGAGHYGILNIDKNTIMENNNTITNALKVDKNNSGNGYTLTINNGGGGGNGTIYIKFDTDAQVGTINNLGTILGNIDNQASSIIKTFNTGSISGSIINNANATIETLNVTGNVANGITNNSNIGSLIVNENVSYSGNGSDRITQALIVEKDKTLTAGSGITFSSTNGTINNAGTINGNITNIADSILTDFTNSGSISGTFTNEGHIVKFVNESTGSINNFVNDKTISFFENNGIITSFNGNNGTIYGVINSKTITNDFSNVATSLWNKENALIQGDVALKGDYKDCSDSGSTICKTSDLINEGTITGNVTNEAGKEINLVKNTGTIGGSIANSGSINTFEVSGTIAQGIINNDNASISSITINEGANLGSNGITNNSNIGTLKVNESVTYNGNGNDRITQALEVAKDKTLTIGSNGTLSFNSKNGSVNNLGTIAGNLSNVKDSIITNFANSGTITGDLYNDGHIDILTNTGTMGTIYNTSKNTIKNLLNDKNSVIAGIDNSNGRYNTLENQGTILGDIKNDNGTITNLVNTNNGTITGQIISNGNSNIGTIINEGVINSSHTMNSGSIQDKTNDAISLDTISNVVTAISNSGSINGNVRVAGNSEVNVIENSKVIAGCIILEGGRIGNINNTNGAIANCMSFSNGASVDNLNNSGTIKDKITNDSGSMTVNNSGSGSIGGITTSNGGTTTIINGGMDKPGGNIGAITNTGSNSNTHIDGWTLDNPDNPSNPIIIADSSNKDGIHLKEDSIFVEGNLESGKIYDYYGYIKDENGNSIGQDFSQDDELFDALTFIPIFNPTDNGDGTFSVGLDTQELSGKTLGASLIYSSRMRQIDTNSMLREINVKNFKTDFEILEQRERLKNQQALLENYKQQRESYLNGLTKDNKELKRVSSKESTSLSTYANNSNIKSDAIEVVDYYNKDTLASLDNLQATTKANQETYSNLDLLRELDDIFISHTGDKDNLYTFALPYTRYTSAQLDGGVGTLKSHASGILAGAQAKLPSERGILGIYFGYESSDKQVGQQRLDFDEKVYYGGLTYYNVFARKGVSEYYLSANTRIDKGDTNLYKTYRTGSTTIDSQVDSYGYGADLKVGANYYNIYNNSVLSPEIGISYQGISTDSFRLRHLGGVSEHYYAQDVNFFDISATLRWQRAWNNVFKTMASLGAMYNVYNDAKGSGVIAGLKQSADINVEELYGTTQVGISYALGENANIALNYSGIFANGVQSHAGYIRLGVWW